MESDRTMGLIKGYTVRIIALVLTVISGLLVYTIPFVDDVPYYEVIDEQVVRISDFTAYEKAQIEDNAISLLPGKEGGQASVKVSLEKGDLFEVSFTCENESENAADITVDLYGGQEYDLGGMERTWTFEDKEAKLSTFLPYYRTDHPDICKMRLFASKGKELKIKDLIVKRMIVLTEGNPVINIAEIGAIILFIASIFVLLFNVFFLIKERPWISIYGKRTIIIKESLIIGFVGLIVTGTLILLYHNADIGLPLLFEDGDTMGVLYFGKLIDEYGFSLVGHRTGGFSGADLYDYPYSDTLSFLIVKLISIFSDNPYLIINYFYFLSFIFAAAICAAVLRYLKLSPMVTAVMSTLYGFMPYLQMRYGHMWLVPCFMMPIAGMISIDIIRDTFHQQENREKYYINILFLSFCCAFTGLYYAFFTCALIGIAMVILIINNIEKGLFRSFYPLGYLAGVLIGVISNIIPNVLYHFINGPNPLSEVAMRGRSDGEIYALKPIQLLLPRPSHRFWIFSKVADKYAQGFPLVNENRTASLGIIAAIGLVISVVLLFRKKGSFREISYLNLSMIFLAIIGGIGSSMTMIFKIPIRCYNRLSVVIMFFSLLMIGVLLDILGEKIKKPIFTLILALIFVVGIYDQTNTYSKQDYSGFQSVQNTIHEIEASVPEGAYIYQLPFSIWPSGSTYRNFIGYIESQNLHWSYGAIQGREESNWQEGVAKAETDSMIEELRRAGYSGIYLDMGIWERNEEIHNAIYSDGAEMYVSKISKELGDPLIKNEYWKIYFWKL